MSVESASSIRREDTGRAARRPLDKVRALQWTLYRSAKQEPERRFHALYGHVHRMDVSWRAWIGVCTNRGAPGVDGVTVDAVLASGWKSSSGTWRSDYGRIVVVRRCCGGSRFPSRGGRESSGRCQSRPWRTGW